MADWIIMGIIFAIIAGMTAYIIWKNSQRTKNRWRKKLLGLDHGNTFSYS